MVKCAYHLWQGSGFKPQVNFKRGFPQGKSRVAGASPSPSPYSSEAAMGGTPDFQCLPMPASERDRLEKETERKGGKHGCGDHIMALQRLLRLML